MHMPTPQPAGLWQAAQLLKHQPGKPRYIILTLTGSCIIHILIPGHRCRSPGRCKLLHGALRVLDLSDDRPPLLGVIQPDGGGTTAAAQQ